MKFLSRQEELVLLTICSFNRKVTLKDIRDHLIKETGKDWSISSVYVPMDRLSEAGYLDTFFGEPTTKRGGKAKRYYKVTDSGIKSLQELRSLTDTMWKNAGGFAFGE